MKKVYVIRKYVLAENVQEALKLDSQTKVDDCYANDDTHRDYLQELMKTEIEGFRASRKRDQPSKKRSQK